MTMRDWPPKGTALRRRRAFTDTDRELNNDYNERMPVGTVVFVEEVSYGTCKLLIPTSGTHITLHNFMPEKWEIL